MHADEQIGPERHAARPDYVVAQIHSSIVLALLRTPAGSLKFIRPNPSACSQRLSAVSELRPRFRYAKQKNVSHNYC
jgi:hypothetical protein